MQWDVEPVAAQMAQMATDLTARIDALDPESESPVFSDFSFTITTGDWELTNGLYKARVNNTVLLTANAGIQVFYDASLRNTLVGDIYEDKHTGYIDFYTTLMPTGSVSGFVRVIDATGGNVQVSRGGTGASTPKGARTNLNTPIRDIPVNFGTVSSLPQTVYDADLTADMVAFDAVFGNPAAIPGGIDVTFAAGSVTITGTLASGAETTISFWAHEQRSAVEGTETPAEQQRITEFVQVQAQTLSAAEQTQVRQNIGAASASAFSELSNEVNTIGTVYTYPFTGGDKTYNTGDVIAEFSVPQGIYIVSFTPGYGLVNGVIALVTDESPNPNKNSYLTVGSGWSGTIMSIVKVTSNNVKIKLSAVSNVSWQSNHSDFCAVRIK